jgi:hypothetical protein
MQQWYQCPNCSASVSFGAKFCNNCGTQLTWPTHQTQPPSQYSCPHCSALVSFGINNCQYCGTLLSWQDQQQSHSFSANQKVRPFQTESTPLMKSLKWAGISILSLLLFLSLFVFGPAFLFKQTALNPSFVTTEVGKLEIASVANEYIVQGLSEDFPKDIEDGMTSAINKLEPRLKQELNTVINSVYDYILGKRENADLAKTLRSTFLNSDFIAAIIDQLDITALVKPIVYEQAAQWIPSEMAFLTSYINPGIDDFVADQEPWIKEQLKANAEQIADYLVSLRNSFKITISTAPVIDSLRNTLLENINELPIPQLTGIPTELIEAVFNEYFNEFSQVIPSSIEINETIIGEETQQEIGTFIIETEDDLKEIRGYINDFQLWYTFLIVFILLLAIGIILIFRNVKGPTRTLGIVFLITGSFELLSLMLVKNTINERLVELSQDIPAQLQQWLLQLINNVSTPLQILSIGFIVGGIVLIVVSIIYKSRHANS